MARDELEVYEEEFGNRLQNHDPFEIPSELDISEGKLPRVAYAYEMRVAGVEWETIATTLGYASADTARQSVLNHIKSKYEKKDIEEIVDLELLRLDRLQTVAWRSARLGDLKAIETVLKIMQQRAKFLGTEKKAGEGEGVTQNNTFFIGGDNGSYVDNLKKAIQQGHGVQIVEGEVLGEET